MAKVVKMTSGNIYKQLIKYAIPLILGNIFQLTYNVVDSVIVGRFIGKHALAAVGVSNPILNIFILGISGLCIGASVIMGKAFGAGNDEKVKKEMATLSIFGVIFSVVILAVGIIFSESIIDLLNVPGSIHSISKTYLRVILLGMPFTFFYNAVSSALKSVGNSRTPLKFLIFASVLNGVLDCIFIGYFEFGIVCSAMTTVVSQFVSALLCIIYVYKNIPMLSIGLKEFKIDKSLLKETLSYGSITALQQACQPIGKLMIQGVVNTMGIDVIASFNAVTKIDDYAFTPEQNISHAMTTFVAQNNGAGEKERIKKGFKTGMFLELIYGICIGIFVFICKEPVMRMFVGDKGEKVILQGCAYLGLMAMFYILPSFTNGIQGYFRGIGKMKMTLIGTITQISLRVIFTFVLSDKYGIQAIAYASAVGWIVMLIVEGIYYRSINK